MCCSDRLNSPRKADVRTHQPPLAQHSENPRRVSAEDDDCAAPRAQNENDRAAPLAYWRGFTAEMFDEALRCQVRDCVGRISWTTDEWRAAINGDAAAAVKVASRMPTPAEINSRLDVTMSLLLAA